MSGLNGIYTDTECELGKDDLFNKYEKEEEELSDEDWRKNWVTIVRQGWNGLLSPSDGSTLAKEILVSQLDHYDGIFMTHFQNSQEFYMTDDNMWTSVWPLYVDAVLQHADGESEQPDSNPIFRKIRSAVAGKLRFAMKDHGQHMFLPPPFPILTKSVVPLMTKSAMDIEGALKEVSNIRHDPFEAFAIQFHTLSATHFDVTHKVDSVGHSISMSIVTHFYMAYKVDRYRLCRVIQF